MKKKPAFRPLRGFWVQNRGLHKWISKTHTLRHQLYSNRIVARRKVTTPDITAFRRLKRAWSSNLKRCTIDWCTLELLSLQASPRRSLWRTLGNFQSQKMILAELRRRKADAFKDRHGLSDEEFDDPVNQTLFAIEYPEVLPHRPE